MQALQSMYNFLCQAENPHQKNIPAAVHAKLDGLAMIFVNHMWKSTGPRSKYFLYSQHHVVPGWISF